MKAWVDERNIRSQKVLEKPGARKIGKQQLLDFALTSRLHLTRNLITAVGKINDFMYSIREKPFVNMIFYVGNAEEMRRKAKEEAERKGIKL